MGEIVRYKCSKNERLISRNKKNKKNNVINCNGNKVEELDNGNEGNGNEGNGNEGNGNEGNGNGKGDNEKRLIITQILCVFLIAFTVWKIIST
jgi:hypothetical protein